MTVWVSRALICLGLVLSLAACGRAGDTAPFTDSRMPSSLATRFWAPPNWAWGLIELPGKPALRYGVASPPGVSRGDVVILTGYGETAEGWFQTVRELIDQDYAVWVLEPAGQGGSARYGGARDVGRAPDFEADIDGVRVLVGSVIRPAPDRGVGVIASGTAEPVALAAIGRGLPASVLILSGPSSAPKGGGWTRPEKTNDMTAGQWAQAGWMIANPDLRMGGPGRQWRKAFEALTEQTLDPAFRAAVKTPVVMLAPTADDCAGLPNCSVQRLPGDVAYQLMDGDERQAWLSAISETLSAHHGS